MTAKKKGVDALVDEAPETEAPAEAAPADEPVVAAAEEPAAPASEPAGPLNPRYDHELSGFSQFSPSLKEDHGYDPQHDPRVARNVPADMTVTWATDPRQDKGAHLALMRGLGFRPVRIEEVTSVAHDDTRMFLPHYEVGPHDYVVVGGGVMLIGYRQYRDERRAEERRRSREYLDAHHDQLDNAGIGHTRSSRSGTLSEVM